MPKYNVDITHVCRYDASHYLIEKKPTTKNVLDHYNSMTKHYIISFGINWAIDIIVLDAKSNATLTTVHSEWYNILSYKLTLVDGIMPTRHHAINKGSFRCLSRKDGVRGADGPYVLDTWKLAMLKFRCRKHPMYLIIGHYMLASDISWKIENSNITKSIVKTIVVWMNSGYNHTNNHDRGLESLPTCIIIIIMF